MSEHAVDAPPPFSLGEALREIANGVTSAFVLLALMLPLGLLAFGPISETAAVNAAMRAAFAAAVFGNVTALVLGAPLLPNEIPRASTVFVFAGFILRLLEEHATAAEVVALAALCLVLAGTIQLLFGVLRLGNLARFVPYPVVAGLMTGLAVKLIVYEIPDMMGMHAGAAHGVAGDHGWINPSTLLLAVLTIVVVVFVHARWPKAPAKLFGVVMGTALAVVLVRVLGADTGPHVPVLPHAEIPLPDSLALLVEKGVALVAGHASTLLVSAAAIAVVGSLDSLVAAVGEADGPLDTTHQPNRLLMSLGVGNIVSGCFGGVPLAYSSHHSLVPHRAGLQKLLGSVATTATLIGLLVYGQGLLRLIPLAVLSGIMVVLAFGLIDRWAGATFQRARRRQYDAELWLNLLVVAIVASVTVIDFVAAVITGLVLAMALFVGAMNRSLVRAVSSGVNRASRRMYPTVPASVLRAEGQRTRIMDLDGAIFFGTVDRLAAEVLKHAEGATYVILDLRRVTMIDASGALMLDRLSHRLRQMDVRLLLAHISVNNPLGRALLAAGAFTQKHHPDWFADTDRALEWAERQILAGAHIEDTHRELRLSEFALMAQLTEVQLERMKPYLDRQLFPARSTLFKEGDPADRLYLLARGAVTIMAEDPIDPQRRRRVLTLAPGVMFGETAMLTNGTWTGTGVSEEECLTYSLSRKNLDTIRRIDRDLGEQLLLNMLAHVATLLRLTAGVLREASDAVE
ncbi:MAG: SulP family inorganic anion transporter [Casimicrobiaceae bacterium]